MNRILTAFAVTLLAALPLRAEVDIQQVTSPGGIDAWLVEEPSIPFTALEIRFKGGTSLDVEGKRGAVYLMAGLLEEGAGDMDAREFAAAREALAARFGFDAYDDALSISAQFLTENRDEAVELLRTALVDPRFDEDAITRVRGQVVSGIRSDLTDPNAIASATFDRLAFGDHPYGSPKEGSIESVGALTRDDLIEAHGRTMTRDRLYVAAVGDIDAEELGVLLDRLLGDLPETSDAEVARAPYLLEGGTTVVPFETPQSVVIFGQQGITRDDPDFFAAYVANQILGGGDFSSRLMTEVREKRGLTYGVYSYLVPMDHAELVMGQVASANDRVADAIAVIGDEWQRISDEGVTTEELLDAKTYLTGAYPLRFDGNAQIARIMVAMQMEGQPVEYIATRNDKIEAVTLEDIERVSKRIYDPEALHFVVVGQPQNMGAGN